ncbi:MAG: aminotransferase class III-fold pyridoxal phosphate-dependent enzyme [Thermoanaerobaculia bacterium]|nr:aminotransferase class III-fold pyridoxal phosphate-dependent enzyme [Thermoanaerobaculia bacterium]
MLVFEPAYHGMTLGALAASSRSHFREPFVSHLQPFVERLPFACATEEIASLLSREPRIGCVLVEPIVGREGVLVPPDGWLRALAELCSRAGVLLAVDEILTGFGRTGARFAVDHENVRPDLICCGKALAGGLPIAAVAGKREVMAAWKYPGEARHTATFVAHPLACAAALACLDVLESDVFRRLAARPRPTSKPVFRTGLNVFRASNGFEVAAVFGVSSWSRLTARRSLPGALAKRVSCCSRVVAMVG